MNQTTRDLYERASELSAEERAELAGMLLESLEDEDAPRAEIEKAWAEEIERRMTEVQGSPYGDRVLGESERFVHLY